MNDKPLPILLVKTGTVSKADIRRAEKVGFILIIECAEPSNTRFVHPPIDAKIDAQAAAALSLMRALVDKDKNSMYEVGGLVKWWVKILMDSSRPQEVTPAQKAPPAK